MFQATRPVFGSGEGNLVFLRDRDWSFEIATTFFQALFSGRVLLLLAVVDGGRCWVRIITKISWVVGSVCSVCGANVGCG